MSYGHGMRVQMRVYMDPGVDLISSDSPLAAKSCGKRSSPAAAPQRSNNGVDSQILLSMALRASLGRPKASLHIDSCLRQLAICSTWLRSLRKA